MVGLSAHTIRAWERRYRVPSPLRSRAGHRRYGLEDVEALRRMKHIADLRGVSLKVAALEAVNDLPGARSAWHARGPELELPVEESPWRAAADLLPEQILILDLAGRIVDANIAFARVAGVVRERLRGARFSELVDPYDRAKAAAIWQEPKQVKRRWELNLRTPARRNLASFDCWPLATRGHEALVLIGRDVGDAGVELWPDS